jgi:pyruvate dehydrogenase E2 component (dihydrolipoamide acetyltransferase)
LVAPVITDTDARTLGSVAREAKRLIGLARDGKLGAENLQGGTFTVSNLGMYGVTSFDAIITPPQCAILAVGAVRRVPVFKGDSDEVVAANICSITLSADHRITDGAEAAQFVADIKKLLENPLTMLI